MDWWTLFFSSLAVILCKGKCRYLENAAKQSPELCDQGRWTIYQRGSGLIAQFVLLQSASVTRSRMCAHCSHCVLLQDTTLYFLSQLNLKHDDLVVVLSAIKFVAQRTVFPKKIMLERERERHETWASDWSTCHWSFLSKPSTWTTAAAVLDLISNISKQEIPPPEKCHKSCS